MLLKISRYYNTSERLTGMCQKISAQLIRLSMDWISRGESLWEIPSIDVVERCKECLVVYDEYLQAYDQVKCQDVFAPLSPEKPNLLEMTDQKDFVLDEGLIFEETEKFNDRLKKVITLFTAIAQVSHDANVK